MKMGVVAVAMVMAMVVMAIVGMADAQVTDCLTVAGAGASFDDATTVVQNLRVAPGQCCQTSSGFCTVVSTSGSAAATVCGPTGYCPNCADVGNGLNTVLAQCNVNGQVQGVYSPDGTSNMLWYLTSSTNHP